MSPRAKLDMIRVDRIEYEAFRDAASLVETHKLEAMRAREHYASCLSINRDQVARLNAQDLQLADARSKLAAAQARVADLVAEVEALRRAAPIRLDVGPQPLFAKRA